MWSPHDFYHVKDAAVQLCPHCGVSMTFATVDVVVELGDMHADKDGELAFTVRAYSRFLARVTAAAADPGGRRAVGT